MFLGGVFGCLTRGAWRFQKIWMSEIGEITHGELSTFFNEQWILGEMMIHHITIEFGWTCGRTLFQKMSLSESLG